MIKKVGVILAGAFIGWALCGATMGVGMSVTTIETTLIVHAIGAPVFFFIISWFYHRRFGYTPPLATAAIFVLFVIVVDFFVVALLIQGNLDMFRSFLGTWLPFLLIFGATWAAGAAVGPRREAGA